jgi:hypothetical protein
MVFSNNSLKSGLVEDIDFGLNTDSTSYPLVDKARNINAWFDRVVSLILRSDTSWEWDDVNHTDRPIATCNLVSAQQDYTVDGLTFLKIMRVEVQDSNGNWTQLDPITQDMEKGTALTEFEKTNSVPLYYDKMGDSLDLYPAPNYSKTNALKVYYQREPSYFASNDTTKEPGFASLFHRILSYGAQLDYCMANNLNGRIGLLQPRITQIENEIIEFYTSRDRDMKVRARLQKENYGQEETYISEDKLY